MVGKFKRLGIVLLIGLGLFLISFVDPSLMEWLPPFDGPWWYVNIPFRIFAGIAYGIVGGVFGLIVYSCVMPFVLLVKWIIKGK